MSLINTQFPPDYISLQDQLWVVAESDNYEQVNFKYIFDIYDNNTNQQLIRAKIYPDVNSGMGYFDFGSVIRNCIDYNWFFPYDSIAVVNPTITGQIGVTYRIEIGEEYNIGASGIQTINITDYTGIAVNYTPTRDDRRTLDILSYTNKFLSTRPLKFNNSGYAEITLKRNEPFFIGYLGDINGGPLISYSVNTNTSTYDSDTSSSSRFAQFNIGPKAVSLESGIVDDTVSQYSIDINGNLIYVNIDDCPTLHEPHYLIFLNRFGMFDTAAFTCVSKYNMTVGRKAFETKEAKFNGLDVDYNTNTGNIRKWNESKVNYAQNIDWNYKLTMNFPTDEEYIWLAELIYSPLVYLQVNNGAYTDYFPVTIKNTNYEESKQIYNKLKTLEIEVERNTKLNGFRR